MPLTNSCATDIHCSRCENRYPLDSIQKLCTCGSPLLIDYDLTRAAGAMTAGVLAARPFTMYRYAEVLPVQESGNIVTLGEGGTPLTPAPRLGNRLGCEALWLKDESVNPTGSFKARGIGMAISRANELGIDRVIIPTAGNAGSATAAYAARAGMKCLVIMPDDSPAPFLVDCQYHGAEIELIKGSIKDCGARAAERAAGEGWFPVSTLKEPYRIEGKKTMGYELAEQLNRDLPDVIIYPTGGGTGLIGMWKAFDELERMGWIDSRRPRMVAVQADGCAPIPRAFEKGWDEAGEWKDPHTCAAGLRVPSAVGDRLMLRAIRETGGTALTVSDRELMDDTRVLAETEGLFAAPEAGACVAALRKLLDRDEVKPDERIVVFVTGSGYKYLDVIEEDLKG
jgi:threonine synthase